jgi:hypothetical protein
MTRYDFIILSWSCLPGSISSSICLWACRLILVSNLLYRTKVFDTRRFWQVLLGTCLLSLVQFTCSMSFTLNIVLLVIIRAPNTRISSNSDVSFDTRYTVKICKCITWPCSSKLIFSRGGCIKAYLQKERIQKVNA